MGNIYIVPEWFFRFGIGLEVLFALIAGIISFYSYRINKISCDRKSFLFTIGFALISLSYFVKILLNLFVLSEVKNGLRVLNIDNINFIGLLGTYMFMIIFLIGILTLVYITFNTKSTRAFLLLVIMTFLVIIFTEDTARAFVVTSSIILLFLSIHFWKEYASNKNSVTLILFLAFLLLFFSGLGFIISVEYYLNFVISHVIEFIAYVLMLLGLGLIIKKENG
jgi:hypothetical protein